MEYKKIIQSRFEVVNNIKKIDMLRKLALSKQDSISYYNLCCELGIEPEDMYLYNSGKDAYEYQRKINFNLGYVK
jgi:hypothetical protein